MNARPLYHRFTTTDHYYVYDTYSNQILDTPQPVWEGLDQALADSSHDPSPNPATPELEKAQKAGYLLPCEVAEMRFYPRKEMMLARIGTRLPQLTLELTEQCNFRCRYCEYSHQSDRVYRPKEMTRVTALNAIRFYLTHSTEANERCISFWGGEALIKFRLIKEVIEHVRSLTLERPPVFQFTTNGALITPEIARFLSANQVALLVSLDGPQHVHDRHRINAAGRGTFESVMRGVRHLYECDPEYYRQKVRFNCVVAEGTPLDDVIEFFTSHELLRGQRMLVNPAILPATACEDYGGFTPEQLSYLNRRFLRAVATGPTPEQDPWAWVVSKALQRIALRNRSPIGSVVHPNGCCVPLLKKMHVRVNGDIYLCEQVPHTNCIGNVNEHVDLSAALALVDEYVTNSLPDCRECWAVRLCNVCYQQSMHGCGWNPVGRQSRCDQQRRLLSASLAWYAAIIERCPTAFEHLKNVAFTYPV